jgi:serine phosphatase RsbU (regulator of sigma subunit)
LGVLKADPHHFSATELELLSTFASQAAVAVEKARLRDQQRDIAESLQRSMLPAEIPKIPGIECGRYYCAAAESALIGGDFFDMMALQDERWMIAIGDVCGHGTEATVTIAMDKYALRAYATEDSEPANMLNRLNRTRRLQAGPTEFTTLFCGVYDPATRVLHYSNAGSPALACCSKKGQLTESTLVDPPVGLPFEIEYHQSQWQLNPGDVFMLFTDGLYEAKNADGDEFGLEKVHQLLIRHRNLAPQRLAERIFREVARYSGGKIRDDIAILVFRVKGEEADSK